MTLSENPESTHIRIPVQRAVVLSTTHIPFFQILKETSCIIGVANSQWVNNQQIRQQLQSGKTIDIGNDRNLNYELLASLNPDVVFLYGIGSENLQVVNKLKDLGIPAVFIAEYLERHPLGKAEWLKFVSCFFGKEPEAQQILDTVFSEYHHYCEMTKNISNHPKILTGLPWKNTWWFPGENSYAAQLISDAGAELLISGKNSHEAIPLNLEAVSKKAEKADFWINCGAAGSKKEILSVDERMADFKIFKTGNIYNNNARTTSHGGNDYWESGILNPQIILKDLINIFHPELLENHHLFYYQKIK